MAVAVELVAAKPAGAACTALGMIAAASPLALMTTPRLAKKISNTDWRDLLGQTSEPPLPKRRGTEKVVMATDRFGEGTLGAFRWCIVTTALNGFGQQRCACPNYIGAGN